MAIRELPPVEQPAPRPRRHVRPSLVVLLAAALASGLAGWFLRGALAGDPVDPAAVAVGDAGAFAVGTVTEVDVEVDFYDPYGVENADAEHAAGPSTREALLFVTHDADAGLVALHGSGRWLGCRVRPIDRTEALEFFPRLPAWFETGLVDPCHGGLYALTGEQVLGPGHRGLDRFPVSFLPDGTLTIDLTRPERTGSVPGLEPGVTSSGAATS